MKESEMGRGRGQTGCGSSLSEIVDLKNYYYKMTNDRTMSCKETAFIERECRTYVRERMTSVPLQAGRRRGIRY